jgi:hypothetical protein
MEEAEMNNTAQQLRELSDAEIDAVSGGDCVIGDAGQTALQTQLSFFTSGDQVPIPGGLTIFETANGATGGCFTLPS